MNIYGLFTGVLCCLLGVIIFPLMKKEVEKNQTDNVTIKGTFGSILLIIFGLYFIAREFAKII